jgi:trimeric autotransporter adhesin
MATSARSLTILAWALSMALAGCGGGGSGPAATTPPPGGTAPPPPPPPAGDTNLTTLGLSVGALDQQFQPGLTSYTATLGYLDNAVHVELQPADSAATVRVNGTAVTANASQRIELSEGQNAIDIAVQNGSVQKTYSIALTRETRATFGQSAYIKASNTGIEDVFGTTLALSGDTLVVGAPFQDGGSSDSGAAYVFVRDTTGGWNQQAYLKAMHADPIDNFGYSVAIHGDRIAVGAPSEDSDAVGVNGDQADNSLLHSGAAYIFARDSSGQWTQEAYIKPSNPQASGGFGNNVALDGDTLVVSAPMSPMLVGSVYVFTRDAGGTWSQQAVIAASDPIPDAGFGQSLALQGDTLAVGAKWHTGVSDQRGAVYIFKRQGSGWSELVRLKASNAATGDIFGSSVALSGDTLAVGAPGRAGFAGAVYVFDRNSAGNWAETAFFKASNTEPQDSFGYEVALSGDWLAVSAENESGGATGIGGTESDNTKPGAGAGYLFVRNGSGNWSQQLYVKASNSESNDRFGRSSAALSNSTLVFAAPFEDGNATGVNGDSSNNTASSSGAVYVFE